LWSIPQAAAAWNIHSLKRKLQRVNWFNGFCFTTDCAKIAYRMYVQKHVGTFVNIFCSKGYGTHFYDETSYYEGEWYCGKRNGWGRMTYPDCSVYEGEWYDDKRCGQGMLRLGEKFSIFILS
jgi:hypothetical protein